METFLIQASIYLLAAVFAVPIATRLGLGSVLGYLLAGIVIGPIFGLVGSETESLQSIAEFGVVMMLFIIGLELEPRTLWEMRHKLVGLGVLQIGLTAGVIASGAVGLGLAWPTAIAIGFTFSLSSTAIVMQTLSEKNLTQTPGGRSVFSVLLAQDIAVIPLLALLPLLAIQGLNTPTEATGAHGEVALSLVQGLPGWGVTLVTVGAIGLVVLFGVYATRPLFNFIHGAKLREMYTAVALMIVVGIASLMNLVGLSPALGTFLAGVVLANSEFKHELEASLQPFKGLLLGLFFITVGSGIDFAVIWSAPVTIVGLTLLIMLSKGAVLYILAMLFRMKGRDKWLFTLGLAQAGEFGLVLVGFVVQQSIVPNAFLPILLIVIALSMLLTPLFFILYEYLAKRFGDRFVPLEMDDISAQGPVIIAGVGRFGQVVNSMVRTAGHNTTVLDNDIETIKLMRRFGVKAFFGDPTRPELLHAAGLADAASLVVALDDKTAAIRLVEMARRARPDLHIVARAFDRQHVYRLYNAGANDIVREMFDSSLRAGRYVLENIGLTEYESHAHEVAFYTADRHAMGELAKLWKPGMKLEDNAAYMDRALELEKKMELELMTQKDDPAPEKTEDDDPALEMP